MAATEVDSSGGATKRKIQYPGYHPDAVGRDDEVFPRVCRRKQAMVPDLIRPRGRDQRDELCDEIERLEDEVRRPDSEGLLESVQDTVALESRYSVSGEGRPE